MMKGLVRQLLRAPLPRRYGTARVTKAAPRTMDAVTIVDTPNHEWHWTMLMEQSLDGDCAAYGRLLSALTPALRRTVKSRANAAGLEAEDVVQEVLLALHLKRNTWVRGTPVAPWVAAIARNKIVDAWRRRGRRIEVSLDSVADTLGHEEEHSDGASHDIERGLATLTERQRDVLLAVSLQGFTAQEAALRLRMSEVSVRVTLHRALKSLATLFRKGPHED
jgi:RNA polymerase sigma-70 factor (ECF subfamily)